MEMGLMGFNNWDILLTLIIAVYGAMLSTYTIWVAKQESKRKIKVELSYGFNTNPLVKAETLLLIRAMNLGRKTVTLSSVGLILK